MKYLKHANKQFLLDWVTSIYEQESIRYGQKLPVPGCSYGEPQECLDGEWALRVVPWAEVYVLTEPFASHIVSDPEFPAPVVER